MPLAARHSDPLVPMAVLASLCLHAAALPWLARSPHVAPPGEEAVVVELVAQPAPASAAPEPQAASRVEPMDVTEPAAPPPVPRPAARIARKPATPPATVPPSSGPSSWGPAPATEVPVAAAQPALVPASYRLGALETPAPAYPPLARLRGWEGKVVLRVAVDEKGQPRAVALEGGSGFSVLDEAAAEAVRRWRFTPARRGDEAVADQALVPIVFRLEKDHP